MSIFRFYRLILRCDDPQCTRPHIARDEVIDGDHFDSCLYTATMARGWEVQPTVNKAFCPACKKKLIRAKENKP